MVHGCVLWLLRWQACQALGEPVRSHKDVCFGSTTHFAIVMLCWLQWQALVALLGGFAGLCTAFSVLQL
jgi:hypothetical protein